MDVPLGLFARTVALAQGDARRVSYTHRHYIKDDEYIPFDPTGKPEKTIPAFLEREIEKTIVRWEDRPQLGYEILPNKYFYRYTPPPAADDLLQQFWKLEKEAEGLLMGLTKGGQKR